ncbi:hypothetical protein [Vibrio phage vB_pir03]|nr:hypothetical protein [Vibrio phage vB_pir03]
MKTLTKLATLVLAATSFAATANVQELKDALPTFSYQHEGYTKKEVEKFYYTAALCTEAVCENGSDDYVAAYRFKEFVASQRLIRTIYQDAFAEKEGRRLRNLAYHGKDFEIQESLKDFNQDFEGAMIFWEDAGYLMDEGYPVSDLIGKSIENPFGTLYNAAVENEYAYIDALERVVTTQRNSLVMPYHVKLSKADEYMCQYDYATASTEEKKAKKEACNWMRDAFNYRKSSLGTNNVKIEVIAISNYFKAFKKHDKEAYEAQIVKLAETVVKAKQAIAEAKYAEFLAYQNSEAGQAVIAEEKAKQEAYRQDLEAKRKARKAAEQSGKRAFIPTQIAQELY